MKSLNTLMLTLVLLAALKCQAQIRFIQGTVKDAVSRQRLAFCNLTAIPTRVGTHTDLSGNFSLGLPAGEPTRLIVSYVGYETDTVEVSLEGPITIYLNPTPGALNEVIITGVSRATLIRENPVSIVSVAGREMETTVQSNIIDVLVNHVPGLNAVKTGPNISKPFIRGLGYNRVLTLFDGIRQEGQQWGDEHGIEVDAYHLERAEVIKGPASLMYGSDAVAGVVSLFPAVHRERDGLVRGKFISEYQSNNRMIGNGIRIGYGLGHWILNVQASHRVAANYTNRVDGPVYNTGFQEMNGAMLAAYAGKSGQSKLNLTLYDNLQGIPDGSRDSLTRKFTMQTEEFPEDQIKLRTMVPDQLLDSYTLSPLHQRIQHYRIYSSHHYQIGNGGLDGLLGFQQNIRREYNHPSNGAQPGLYVRLNTLNYGLRYDGPEFSGFQLAGGINGMLQSNKNLSGTDFPIPDYGLLDAGSYVFANWKHSRWTATGGGRIDFRHLSGDDFYVKKNPSTGWMMHERDSVGSTLQYPALSKTYVGISWSAGTTFQMTEHFGLKANIAQGYRAPNITEIASAGLDPGAHIMYLGNRAFIPEFNLEEDIGVNGMFKGVVVSVSIFNNNVRHYIYLAQLADAQGQPVVLEGGNRVFQYRQSAAQLYGMEATVDIHPGFISGFRFNGNFSSVYGFNKKEAYVNSGVQGEFLPFIPPVKILCGVSQEIKTGVKGIPAMTFKAEMDFNAAQNRFLALDRTETRTAGYTLWSAGLVVGVRAGKKSTMQFQFQINNLFDRTYQSNLSRLKYFEYFAQSPNHHSGIYGMGRNACVKLIFSF